MGHLQHQEALPGSPSWEVAQLIQVVTPVFGHKVSWCHQRGCQKLRREPQSRTNRDTSTGLNRGVLAWGRGSSGLSGKRWCEQKKPCGCPSQGPQAKGLPRLGCDSEVGIFVTLILEHRWSMPHLDVSPELSTIPREAPEFIIQHIYKCLSCARRGSPRLLRVTCKNCCRASDS